MAPRRPAQRWAPLASLLWAASAAAGNAQVSLEQGHTRDSNLFRLADDAVLPDGLSRADSIASTTLGGRFDTGAGRVALRGDAALRSTRHELNPRYDHEGHDAGLGLDWSTLGRTRVTLGTRSSRSLQALVEDAQSTFRPDNLERADTWSAGLTLGEGLRHAVSGSTEQRRVRNSDGSPAAQARDRDQTTASVGWQWQPGGGWQTLLSHQQARGTYPRYAIGLDGAWLADRYRSSTTSLALQAPTRGASALTARLGHSRSRYDLNTARDFAGVVGELSWAWQAGGRTGFNLLLRREDGRSEQRALDGAGQSAGEARSSDVAQLGASYRLSGGVALQGQWRRTDRDITRRATQSSATQVELGREQVSGWSLGFTWTTWTQSPAVQLACEAGRELRRGDAGPADRVLARTVGCRLRLGLG